MLCCATQKHHNILVVDTCMCI